LFVSCIVSFTAIVNCGWSISVAQTTNFEYGQMLTNSHDTGAAIPDAPSVQSQSSSAASAVVNAGAGEVSGDATKECKGDDEDVIEVLRGRDPAFDLQKYQGLSDKEKQWVLNCSLVAPGRKQPSYERAAYLASQNGTTTIVLLLLLLLLQ
jgi:hypothetical protein